MLLKGAYCVGEHFVDPQCPNLHALKINKQYSYMTTTASEVYADVVLLY